MTPTAPPAGQAPERKRNRTSIADKLEKPIVALIYICGWSAILFVTAIFFFVFKEGAPALGELDMGEFFFNKNWRPTSVVEEQYGILALLYGTISVSVFSMLMAVPLGLGAAVYVSEFATGKTKEWLKIIIELLAAIPSVVWGFVGVVVMAPIIQDVTGAAAGTNILNASVVLALMSVPIIVSVGEDSLRAVPDTYREAAQALGAGRWEIIYRVLFPAARSGLLAAVLLGVGRAIGETMAVLMCTGHAIHFPETFLETFNVLQPVRTLTATIASELGEVSKGETHYNVLFLIGIVLFILTFIVNLTADLVVKGIKGQEND